MFSLDDPRGNGDHENTNGPTNYDNCESKHYRVREKETHIPFFGPFGHFQPKIVYTRLSDPDYPLNPTVLTDIPLKEYFDGTPSYSILIPVEYR